MSSERIAELKARWLPVYLVLLVAVALLIAHFVALYAMTGKTGYANMAVLTALAGYFLYINFDRLRKIKVERRRVVELVSCPSCGFREERGLEAGDYISAAKGPCPKCGSQLVVEAIYSVREPE